MIDWAVVGKRVVCIEDLSYIRNFGCGDEIFPVKNQILTIREIKDVPLLNTIGLLFEEIINEKRNYKIGDNEEFTFGCQHFRPVKETSIECFQSILTSPPKTKILEEVS